jgi:YcxB-like protein
LLFSFSVVVSVFVLRARWDEYPIAIVLIIVVAGSVPFREILDIRRVAKTYSLPHATYAASFTDAAFVWQAATGTYEIAWDSVAKIIDRERVFVLTLESSRAIAVLPFELLTPNGEAHLQNVIQRLASRQMSSSPR